MTPDPLDELLDRSSPMTRAAVPADLRAMIGAARREVRPTGRRRVGIAAGALTLLLVGGAGVAVATDGFGAWTIPDPVGGVAFTMANGFDCELRFSGFRSGPEFVGDPALLAEANQALEVWYRSADVVAEAQSRLPQKRDELARTMADSADDPGADMSELSPQARADEIEHRAWAREWLAWDLVVSDLEYQALQDAGISYEDGRFAGSERSGQIQCFDEDGALYVPGAGS